MLDSSVWHQLFVAMALVLVIEGVMPFLNPQTWREMLVKVLSMPDRSIRVGALCSMLLGTALLYWLKS